MLRFLLAFVSIVPFLWWIIFSSHHVHDSIQILVGVDVGLHIAIGILELVVKKYFGTTVSLYLIQPR
jgi:hypothetical protein